MTGFFAENHEKGTVSLAEQRVALVLNTLSFRHSRNILMEKGE
jgi:hypothetical protein